MGPPVQGLSTKLGYTCRGVRCARALVDLAAMNKHEKKDHQLSSSPPYPPRPQFELQTLFNNPKKYFVVNSSLAAAEDPDVVQRLAEDFIPFTSYSPAILTAMDDHGRATLERHFRLDDLLLDVRASNTDLGLLVSLKGAAGADEGGGMYTRLASAVTKWHEIVVQRMTGHTAQFDSEGAIIHGSDFAKSSR